jgi:hypothetical protein
MSMYQQQGQLCVHSMQVLQCRYGCIARSAR